MEMCIRMGAGPRKIWSGCRLVLCCLLAGCLLQIGRGARDTAPPSDQNAAPKLCHPEPTICEGSYCIPKVGKCVCDLRAPVQIGRFCLRQVDIYGDCFAGAQCNHTIREAVCLDHGSRALLDHQSGLFKLDQWFHLNEHRLQQPQRSSSTPPPAQPQEAARARRAHYLIEPFNYSAPLHEEVRHQSRGAVLAAVRTSPYEINYDTEKLLAQNHTRRQNFYKSRDLNSTTTTTSDFLTPDTTTTTSTTTTTTTTTTTPSTTTTSDPNEYTEPQVLFQDVPAESTTQPTTTTTTTTTTQYKTSPNEAGSRRVVVITARWPPGTCYCPLGLMFDSMLRRCVTMSLVESHCITDHDCRQIQRTHCSRETRKCACDEPYLWNQTELACVIPPPPERPPLDNLLPIQDSVNIFSPLLLSKLFDAKLGYITLIMMLLAIIMILGVLLLLKITVGCFSHKNSALISPKKKKKQQHQVNNNLPPKSPYATLKRPDHKPASQLSDFTQATRGRILNYDFEQENSLTGQGEDFNSASFRGTLKSMKEVKGAKSEEMKKSSSNQKLSHCHKSKPDASDSPIELNDNISISQLESESKSDNSVLAIPAPPPTQQPSYMMASVMRGQSSTIAAAAAAVANRRIQMAQAKSSAQQHSANGKGSDGHPVFL